MIYITKNTTNDVVLNLMETGVYLMPYYIFEFVAEWNKLPSENSSIYFYTPDVSVNKNRYNEFTIIDNDITGATGSTSNLPLNMKSGQYKYNIYISGTSSLNPATFGDLVDTGRMVVTGIDTQIDSRYL